MQRILLIAAVLVSFLTLAPTSQAQDCTMEGRYDITDLDGTDPYAAQNVTIGVDILDLGDGLYVTWGWHRVGAGPIVYAHNYGLLYMWCGEVGTIISGGMGYQGTLTYDGGTDSFVADYASAGGNTRSWTRQ
jgi:hypothetical protein